LRLNPCSISQSAERHFHGNKCAVGGAFCRCSAFFGRNWGGFVARFYAEKGAFEGKSEPVSPKSAPRRLPLSPDGLAKRPPSPRREARMAAPFSPNDKPVRP